MHLHAHAKLTRTQRHDIRRRHQDDRMSITALATRFQVKRQTATTWAHRDTADDVSSAPVRPRTGLTDASRAAGMASRHAPPSHGPLRIAPAWHAACPQAHRETLRQILPQATRISPTAPRPTPTSIPVGRPRVPMDIHQLPAIEGQTGCEDTMAVIPLGTRVTSSAIHPDARSQTVAGVLRRACARLPPFVSS